MPYYLDSHAGGYQNSELRPPQTYAHMAQFLSYCPDRNWRYIQKAASEALEGKIHIPRKIKPSSLKLLKSTRAFDVIPHLRVEYQGHHDANSEVHSGGGIYEAIHSVFQIVGGWIGGEKVNRWFAGEKEVKSLSHSEQEIAQLLQATYQDKRYENVGNWTRMDDYDSEYGSIWKNPSGKYMLTVRGTKLHFKDIFSDMQIAAGEKSLTDDDLVRSMRRFNKDHPRVQISVAGHSLGTQLAWNGMQAEKLEGLEDVYLFNPASSPFQDKSAVRDIVDSDYNVKYFLNTSDVVSNYFSQNMTPEEIDAHVKYGRFAKSPLAAHGLAQWVEDY